MIPKILVNIRSTFGQHVNSELPIGWLPPKFWSKNDQKFYFFKSVQTFSIVLKKFPDRFGGVFTDLKRFVRQEQTRRENCEKQVKFWIFCVK